MGTRRIPAYTSFLRVFVPLSAYPDPQRRYWAAYAERAEAAPQTRAEGEAAELAQLLAVVRDGAPDLDRLPTAEHAYVERQGDGWLVCPWDLPIRALRAVADAPEVVEHPLAGWYAPPRVAREADRRLRRLGERHRVDPDGDGRGARSTVQVLEEPWGVPGHWFALFESRERLLEHDDGDVRLRYRTSMRQARRRVHAALRVVRRAGRDHELSHCLVDHLLDLGRWLAAFHPGSVVELDYGGLARLVGRASLELDDSPAELQQAFGFARENDLDAAAEQFHFVQSRWEDLRHVHRWN